MSYDPQQLQLLADRLRREPWAGPEIFAAFINASPRLATLKKAGKAGAIDRLLQAGAWTDLALALIEHELPGWTLRCLVCEDGEWFCSLSQQPNLPLTVDDTVDAHHPVIAFAILSALTKAGARMPLRYKAPGVSRVPGVRPTAGHAMCCDNFA
jgi:hypothetical protein